MAGETCPTCRGTGWLVRRKDARETVARCPDCRPTNRVNGLLARAEIPPRYFDRGFDVYSIHDSKQEAALTRSIRFVEEFPDNPRGLLLAGPCGVGKTHLSVAVLKAIVTEKLARGRFVDETELFRRLHYSYQRDSAETERDVLRPLMEADLLVWDDLGTGRPTEWALETMRTVVNYRYTYNKLTIFTTNRALSSEAVATGRRKPSSFASPADPLMIDKGGGSEKSLAENIGQRLYSRIMEMCETVRVSGPDWRIDIQKAGYDFRKSGGSGVPASSQTAVPSGKIRCPHCGAGQVAQRDVARQKKDFAEISYQCEKCEKQFVARYFPQRGDIEYPPLD